ncbi:hypothetical protein BEL04_15345 [Mucilaginibacter sp. PPCGB 2223]|uniref:hypothetical protein n=1 Tax=Mucilaginibacter sp. PPCGB 2223 TaxID=1886027 RepID=UPI000825610A|nr:hypothetical protein [Mucilaginibacter sp. PPCGB 2223]OCX51402.1 hypothetical protein BEL04_15345 [Mucilaginibacter sp. PPCGB 2223]
MKRLALLLSLLPIFTFTQNGFAQKKKIVDDMYGKDTSDAPRRTVVTDTKFSVKDFASGYLVMPDDSLLYGWVRFNGSVAIFKDTLTNKIKRYGPKDINGFVAGTDTFKTFVDTIVLEANPYYRGYYGNQMFLNTQFAQQLIHGNKVSLYKSVREYPNINNFSGYGYYPYRYYRGADGTISQDALYLQRKGQWGYIYVPNDKRAFKRLMLRYFADNRELVQEINSGKLTYDDLDEIVKRYNDTR